MDTEKKDEDQVKDLAAQEYDATPAEIQSKESGVDEEEPSGEDEAEKVHLWQLIPIKKFS